MAQGGCHLEADRLPTLSFEKLTLGCPRGDPTRHGIRAARRSGSMALLSRRRRDASKDAWRSAEEAQEMAGRHGSWREKGLCVCGREDASPDSPSPSALLFAVMCVLLLRPGSQPEKRRTNDVTSGHAAGHPPRRRRRRNWRDRVENYIEVARCGTLPGRCYWSTFSPLRPTRRATAEYYRLESSSQPTNLTPPWKTTHRIVRKQYDSFLLATRKKSARPRDDDCFPKIPPPASRE
ncbi:hypothetical protein CPLU01_04181 [Colletotrichum plurivorum]|uniref:Uncharacterized protein n=1 Tax=Colletotrichum plurivorum TaxID=2175906 RepID=A0A8H6NKD4_9PEZI|nr:hypothetical protein CPLU01_04181 [Colletotrichum plurivorum]